MSAGSFDAGTRAAMVSARVAVLELVRHGEVESMGLRAVRGQLDSPLSSAGEREEARVVEHLGALPIGRVVSSDLPRCRRLAERLARLCGVPLELCPELREQSMGRWEGRSWEQLQAEDGAAVEAYWADFFTTRPPEGESFSDLCARVVGWFEAQREALMDRHTALVTHAGPIRALLCHTLAIPFQGALRLAPGTGSRTRILWAEAGGVLEVFGEKPRGTGP